ncbi:hypothetical protein V6D52_12190 [Idiomarina loihiensis]|jgi:hypothetical protein|uniref:Uncharacterized conserved protein n=1 Tax=Idiomarina loihiensis (strain ATCC BAA-735 / DSM 15497 / L2-TR) TaxID=283942 RepID=Q5QWW8_IDILO|nr:MULTISPECIES: hypothetical protein [Idiomarina]NWO01487.1 hypothetical protein [Idiomarinaceae bacterium]AAV81417.1 Uncharacterized conserved protein [Idiomarina loihiensis L2TR]AGM35444.1 hypothetical protein K734_02885 [Idiomarina loihiensis GSL 199]MBL4855515.1 hypothetical protein [Idiomarina sp.]MRJ45141.1 hypothetical protein [Idiomarina loihiensis]|tara:strand:- start:676 stop:882 length:207 start_codon:yes stop_codon:yes gene_type:complete
MDKIDRAYYPELDKLLWDTNTKYLTPKEALDIYETRWRFVEERQLLKRERQLIDKLAKDAGGFLPSAA